MDQNSIVTISEIQKAENKTFNSAKKVNLAIENAGLIIAQEASINASFFVSNVTENTLLPNIESWFKRTGIKDKYI